METKMANYETTNTQCEELRTETSEESYKTSAFGMEFFNVEQCNKDIDKARADINRAMHALSIALERLDKAQASLDESTGVAVGALVAIDPEDGIKCDAEFPLNSARDAARLAKCCAVKSSERILSIICQLYAAGVKPDINDEDDGGEWA